MRVITMTRDEDMRSYRYDPDADPNFQDDVRTFGNRCYRYLRTRSAEHWMLFLGGLVLGLVL